MKLGPLHILGVIGPRLPQGARPQRDSRAAHIRYDAGRRRRRSVQDGQNAALYDWMMTGDRTFTPALGRSGLSAHYDRAIAIMTRERRWRGKLLAALAPRVGETIVDLGAGTGSLAIMIKNAQPLSTVIGIDPDPAIIAVAQAKIAAAGHEIEMIRAYGDASVLADASADKVVSSLVLHQCSHEAKSGLLGNALLC